MSHNGKYWHLTVEYICCLYILKSKVNSRSVAYTRPRSTQAFGVTGEEVSLQGIKRTKGRQKIVQIKDKREEFDF